MVDCSTRPRFGTPISKTTAAPGMSRYRAVQRRRYPSLSDTVRFSRARGSATSGEYDNNCGDHADRVLMKKVVVLELDSVTAFDQPARQACRHARQPRHNLPGAADGRLRRHEGLVAALSAEPAPAISTSSPRSGCTCGQRRKAPRRRAKPRMPLRGRMIRATRTRSLIPPTRQCWLNGREFMPANGFTATRRGVKPSRGFAYPYLMLTVFSVP